MITALAPLVPVELTDDADSYEAPALIFDAARLEATLADLDLYLEISLQADVAAMDPWTADELPATRLNSL